MIRRIKIHVNTEQSEIIQKICFENDICWVGNGKVLSNIDVPYLFIGYNYLDCDSSGSVFKDSKLIEVDADTFIKKNYKPKDIALEPYNVVVKIDSTMFNRLNRGEDVNIKLTFDTDSVTNTEPVKEEVKPWRAKTKFFQISQYGVANKADDHHSTFSSNPGFNSKSYAEMVADEVYKLKAMYSWLEENDDGWEPDWKDEDQVKCCVSYNNKHNRYVVIESYRTEHTLCVYMSKDNAHKLCKLLNDGLVKLTCRN